MRDKQVEFAQFVAQASASLQRTAYLVCADEHYADDAVQDGLTKVYLAWSRLNRNGNVLGYARRAVVNAAIDASRRPWRRERVTAELPERSSDPDGLSAYVERDEVLTALATLPPRRRACVVLRYYEDLSVEETAAILGCSAGTVKSQTARGIESLRQTLAGTRSAAVARKGEGQ
ncbi:SigE family RNA polymerase sigma factor [Kribbella deserti]|uniref:SigE family RNA polymerase sigma factor n=1 Tax=Kribbella deserti TaxID=1926257 RepID=A0ABV6QJA5_9ACTN